MIYLFSGDDAKNKVSAYEKFMGSISNEVETFFISRNDFDPVQIESLYSGAGLFFSKSVVVFSNVLETEETREFIIKKLEFIGQSNNSFVFLEGKLTKPILDKFKKARAEINSFELPKAKKEKFNNFLLANAFGQKDKLSLWINFRLAMDKGVGMEELIGVLFWKVKDMIIKKDFQKISEVKLKESAAKLSYLLPKARKSGLDAESAFEQFLLKAF